MQKILSITGILLFCGCLLTAQQPKNRTNSTIVADVLAQMPASNTETFNQLMSDLASTGEEGVIAILKQFKAPAQGSNAPAEYALSGLAAYVSAAGREDLRLPAVNGFLQALDEAAETETKAFIIRQLAIAGGDECVDKLVQYLADEALCHYAAGALSGIGTEKAGNALLNELAKTDHRTASFGEIVAAIERTGVNHYQHGFKSGFTDDYAHSLKWMYAQGKISKDQVRKQVKRLQKQTADTAGVHVRIAVLELQTLYDKSPEVILNALKDKSPEYRQAALRFASASANVELYTRLLKYLPNAEKNVKIEILNFIGSEATDSAKRQLLLHEILYREKELPNTVISNQYKYNDCDITEAAAWALTRLGIALDVMSLITSNDTAVVALGKRCAASLSGDGFGYAFKWVSPIVPKISDAGKIAIVELLAMRKASDYDTVVFSLINNSSPQVQQAACKALKDVVAGDDFEMLCSMLETSGRQTTAPIQEATAASISSYPAKEQAAMVNRRMAMADGSKQHLYYAVLASTGDRQALETVSAGFSTGTDEAKDAAFDALLKWQGAETADILYAICSNPSTSGYHDRAFNAYMQIASNPQITGENRLIYLREAMNIAKTAQQKIRIIDETAKTETFLGLLYAGSFINEPALTQSAAGAVMNIALNNSSYTGNNVRSLLNRAIEVLDNPDADYQREAIRKHLAAMPDETGFVSIFNGIDLTGWKGLVANPAARAKMSAAQLKLAQQKADEQMRSDWKAENGLLVFDGAGYDNICTEKMYADFEMYVDWKLDTSGTEPDAGIYLRGTPQVQIWDTARVNVGAQVGSGGLYNNEVHPGKPLRVADNRTGSWNSFYIKMTGDRVTVRLNGVLVTDDVILENYWDLTQPIPPIEQIELQAHGSRVYYRDIYVRELPRPEPYRLTADEEREGYAILFDGSNMHQWTGNTVDYTIENGELVMNPSRSFGGNLYTKKEYSDFTIRFDFQLTPAANNGLGIRTPMEGDAAYEGMELQILDDGHPVYSDIQSYQSHGSVYGVIAAKRGYLKPVGEWNTQEVTARGDHITVTLNGTVILNGNIREASQNGTIDGNAHPGLLNKKGHIGFLGHGSPLKFRNIRIKEL